MLVMATKIILSTMLLACYQTRRTPISETRVEIIVGLCSQAGAVTTPANRKIRNRRNQLLQLGVTSLEVKRDQSCMRDPSSFCSGRTAMSAPPGTHIKP